MYIAALPKACTARKSSSSNPEEAIMIFLPMEDLTNEINHIKFCLTVVRNR
jgi:hypothetical protein